MKTSSLVIALFGAGMLVSATAAVATTDSPSGADAVQKRIDQWLDGYNQADVAKMMDVFADQGFTDSEEGAPAILDKADCTRIYTGVFAKYRTHIDGVTDALQVSGDMAYDMGHYTIELTPKEGGQTLTRKGHFLEVWHRDDGVWHVEHIVGLADPTGT